MSIANNFTAFNPLNIDGSSYLDTIQNSITQVSTNVDNVDNNVFNLQTIVNIKGGNIPSANINTLNATSNIGVFYDTYLNQDIGNTYSRWSEPVYSSSSYNVFIGTCSALSLSLSLLTCDTDSDNTLSTSYNTDGAYVYEQGSSHTTVHLNELNEGSSGISFPKSGPQSFTIYGNTTTAYVSFGPWIEISLPEETTFATFRINVNSNSYPNGPLWVIPFIRNSSSGLYYEQLDKPFLCSFSSTKLSQTFTIRSPTPAFYYRLVFPYKANGAGSLKISSIVWGNDFNTAYIDDSSIMKYAVANASKTSRIFGNTSQFTTFGGTNNTNIVGTKVIINGMPQYVGTFRICDDNTIASTGLSTTIMSPSDFKISFNQPPIWFLTSSFTQDKTTFDILVNNVSVYSILPYINGYGASGVIMPNTYQLAQNGNNASLLSNQTMIQVGMSQVIGYHPGELNLSHPNYVFDLYRSTIKINWGDKIRMSVSSTTSTGTYANKGAQVCLYSA